MEPAQSEKIDLLMIAIVQVQDLDRALRALSSKGLSATHLSTVGGFLGQRNATLLIGLPSSAYPLAIETLRANCHSRVEYTATPLEGAPFQIPLATPIPVGGATVFTLKLLGYEEVP